MSYGLVFRVGAVLMTAAVGGAIAWVVVGFDRLNGDVAGWPRVEVPGSAQMQLEARRYILYLEGEGSGDHPRPVKVVIKNSRTEERVRATPYESTFGYTPGEESELTAVATVSPQRAGLYEVRASGADADDLMDLAFGDAFGRRLAWIFGGALLLGAVLGISAIVVWIRGGVWAQRVRGQSWSPTG